MDAFSIIYFCIVYFANAISKWGKNLKYCFFICIICGCRCGSHVTTDIVPLETIYVSLKSHKLDIVVFNLVWLLVVYVPHASSFISTQFFILILDCWCGPLYSKFVIFSIFHYYIIILILVPQLFAVFLQVIFISFFLFLWIFFLIGN